MSSFRIQYNGLTLEAGTGYIVTNMSGTDGLGIRTSEDLLTGDHGGNIWAQKYDMRTISITGVINGFSVSDYFDKKRDIVDAFSINSSNVLTVRNWNSTEKTITAKVIVTPMIVENPGEVAFADFHVELKCGEPFWSSETETFESVGLAPVGGTPIKMPVPSPVGFGTGGKVSIENNGTEEYYASFTIKNECSNPTVTNTTTGESFQIVGDFLNGSQIDIYRDTTGLHVMSGSTNLMSSFSGDFFKLAVGTNVLSFTSSVHSSTASLEISFYDRFLSL